jgi:hypothetical protein
MTAGSDPLRPADAKPSPVTPTAAAGAADPFMEHLRDWKLANFYAQSDERQLPDAYYRYLNGTAAEPAQTLQQEATQRRAAPTKGCVPHLTSWLEEPVDDNSRLRRGR